MYAYLFYDRIIEKTMQIYFLSMNNIWFTLLLHKHTSI